jgi:putative ABC transport system permease protein
MIINYFKIALRYLLKNRTFSLINVFGLTLGFLCFLLITLYLHDELSYDTFHADAAKIHRVIQHEQKVDGTIRHVATIAARPGPEAVKQMPEVEEALRVGAVGRITMGNDPANRDYELMLTADPNFFTFFTFPLVEGDPLTALEPPNAIVISESLANKYFGDQNAIGKRLWTSMRHNGQPVEMTVTGVMKEIPRNSHLYFPEGSDQRIDIIFSDKTWHSIFNWYTPFMSSDWESNSFITYLKVKEGADPKALEGKITSLIKANYPAGKEFKSEFSLQNIKDIHLHSDDLQGFEVSGIGINPFYLYTFAAVAILILLIACLNYMNLSTAAAYKRTREIGTRKTLGAQKFQLIAQFSGEAIVLSFLSMLLAVMFLQVLLPQVNEFLEKDLSLGTLPASWLFLMLAVVVLAGALSSLYPAFIIARVMPAEALKKDIRIGSRSLPVRKLLIVAQFSISIMMIACTMIIYRQLQYMRTKDLGINVENLLVIDINSDPLRRNFENVKNEFSKVSGVQSISTSTRVPGEWKSFPVANVKQEGNSAVTEMIYVGIDQDFFDTYHIKLLEGRNFVPGKSDSANAVILTRLAVERLNLVNPVGQIIEIPTVRNGANIEQLETPFRAQVIGVVDNFHFESLRKDMMPLVFAYTSNNIQRIDYYTLRVQTNDWEKTLADLREVNTKIDPNNPLEPTFLDHRFEQFYKADVKRGQIFIVFSCIIVLIACLGLFALVSYSIESRLKEIGIRKVLGASVESIVMMISREFLILVLIAGIIAIPVAFYTMKNWLQDFAYRVPMGAGVFVLAGVLALIVAFFTVSFRSIKAAISNPVDSLRNE